MKYLLFSVSIILLTGTLIPASFAAEYAQVVTTDSGTLDVGIYTVPDTPNLGESTKINIHFLKLNTETKEQHIDYWTAVSKDGNYISGPSAVKHTNPGTATVSLVFPEDGSYKIDVGIEGVLFQAIPVETASFTVVVGQPSTTTEESKIPDWIKNNAGWWADGQIDDGSFISGIQWLISNDVMIIPSTEQGTGDGDSVIPGWIKNNAGWWASGQIPDSAFVSGLQWLITNGIMTIP
jgi:hypothetical protein